MNKENKPTAISKLIEYLEEAKDLYGGHTSRGDFDTALSLAKQVEYEAEIAKKDHEILVNTILETKNKELEAQKKQTIEAVEAWVKEHYYHEPDMAERKLYEVVRADKLVNFIKTL